MIIIVSYASMIIRLTLLFTLRKYLLIGGGATELNIFILLPLDVAPSLLQVENSDQEQYADHFDTPYVGKQAIYSKKRKLLQK